MPGDVDEPDDEPVTVGSAEPPPPEVVHRPEVEPPPGAAYPPGLRQSAPEQAPAPNGWFAGPPDDPDRYELLGTGISGGEGTLWRARYRGGLSAPIPFAVKMLRPPPTAAPGWPTAAERRRWHDQAALLRHLEIDHMVRLHEIFAGPPPHRAGQHPAREAEGPLTAYAVMEWVEGPTLADLLRGSRATPDTLDRRLTYVADVAEALAALHSHTRSGGNPSLHRDVKPTNCIVTPDRGVVLVDLSTMRLVDDGFDPAGMHSPGYTAPEVLAAPHLPRTPSCDLYSLGVLAAFCLLGEDPPLPAAGDALAAALRRAAADAGAADPGALAGLVLAMLATDPGHRPSDTVAWAHALRRAAGGAAGPAVPAPARAGRGARGMRAAVAGVVAAAVIGGIGLQLGWWRAAPQTAPRPAASSSAPSGGGGGSAAADVAPATLSASRGSITSPGEESRVKQCSYLTGTASVPAGVTLVLAMRNLTTSDPHLYVEYVFGWSDPGALAGAVARWRGAQYFGQGDSTVGQHYEVDLIAVPRATALAEHDADAVAREAMARRGKLLDRVRLRRAAGAGPNNFCEGP